MYSIHTSKPEKTFTTKNTGMNPSSHPRVWKGTFPQNGLQKLVGINMEIPCLRCQESYTPKKYIKAPVTFHSRPPDKVDKFLLLTRQQPRGQNEKCGSSMSTWVK